SRAGPVLIAAAMLGALEMMRRLAGVKHSAVALGFYALAITGLWLGEYPSSNVVLPRGSVVLVVVDSLRADRVDAEHAPNFSRLQNDGVRVPQVIPPIART